MTLILGSLQLGLFYGLLALGVYITFRVLNLPDLTVDGSLCTGGAVAAVLIVGGMNPLLALVFAFIAGMLTGLVTGCLLYTSSRHKVGRLGCRDSAHRFSSTVSNKKGMCGNVVLDPSAQRNELQQTIGCDGLNHEADFIHVSVQHYQRLSAVLRKRCVNILHAVPPYTAAGQQAGNQVCYFMLMAGRSKSIGYFFAIFKVGHFAILLFNDFPSDRVPESKRLHTRHWACASRHGGTVSRCRLWDRPECSFA